jgi:two-component system, NtrC family, nitrogen regulation response regulator NtrX
MDGLELLDLVKSLDPDLPVIMISGHGNIETAVSAIKRGAYDFLEKPFKSDRLLLLAERAVEAANLKRENRRLRSQAIVPDGMLGSSQAAQQLRQMIAKVAPANSRVLISGPPGAGKETAARLIHAASPRARGEFVAISAAGMTPGSLDLEFFGEEGEEGRPKKIGVFERAHGGTLYIDDLADMPRETQSRLLRVLVEQRFRRVGGDTDVQVDVRVVSSTSRDLREEIVAGRLREDLFHRLNVVPIRVPGLAERREDIEPNLEFELDRFGREQGEQVRFNVEAKRRYLAFAVSPRAAWAGNFRELSASVTRMATLADAGRITEALAEQEVERLTRTWSSPGGAGVADGYVDAVFGARAAELDLFDRAQLERVLDVCRVSASLSEAGRTLFAVSRQSKKQPNDADRLRKYLARFGLDWEGVRQVLDGV